MYTLEAPERRPSSGFLASLPPRNQVSRAKLTIAEQYRQAKSSAGNLFASDLVHFNCQCSCCVRLPQPIDCHEQMADRLLGVPHGDSWAHFTELCPEC